MEAALGKSDPLDAKAIAEAVLRESERLPLYGVAAEQQALRLRYDRRDRYKKAQQLLVRDESAFSAT